MDEDAGGCCELLSQLQEGKVGGGATKCLPKKVQQHTRRVNGCYPPCKELAPKPQELAHGPTHSKQASEKYLGTEVLT